MHFINQIKEVWEYREFILGSVRREYLQKYRNSLFGLAWVILSPLAMILVYTLVFSSVFGQKTNNSQSIYEYGIFLCSGILTWNYFADLVNRGQSSFIDYANYIKKIKFPKACIPVIVLATSLSSYLIILGIFLLFLIVLGKSPSLAILAAIPVILILTIFSLCLGMLLGIINVFFRDVGQVFSIMLQMWFWLTPIVYPVSVLPPQVKQLLSWNPLVAPIESMQQILSYGIFPSIQNYYSIIFFSLILLGLALYAFHKLADELVDEL